VSFPWACNQCKAFNAACFPAAALDSIVAEKLASLGHFTLYVQFHILLVTFPVRTDIKR
jgi:hypothetical protein